MQVFEIQDIRTIPKVFGSRSKNSLYKWTLFFSLTLVIPSAYADKRRFEILFGGDTAFAKSYHDHYIKSGRTHILAEKGYQYTIKNLIPIIDRADYVVLNLETAITDLRKSEFPDKSYLHYEDPAVVPYLLKRYGVDAVSLANNHTLDFAEEGLIHTLQYLKKQDIAVFGAGLTAKQAEAPHVKSFNIDGKIFQMAVIGSFEYRKKYDEQYRFYARGKKPGSNILTIPKTRQQIAQTKEKYPNAFIIVYPHWGNNYVWKNDEQTEISHALIDAGADLILGHGAHKIQEIKQYKGKWIVYSLGNFLFNTLGGFKRLNAEPYGMVAMLQLTKENHSFAINLNLYPIFSDNRITNFQPYFLSKDEAKTFLKAMQEKSPELELGLRQDKTMATRKYYIQLPVSFAARETVAASD